MIASPALSGPLPRSCGSAACAPPAVIVPSSEVHPRLRSSTSISERKISLVSVSPRHPSVPSSATSASCRIPTAWAQAPSTALCAFSMCEISSSDLTRRSSAKSLPSGSTRRPRALNSSAKATPKCGGTTTVEPPAPARSTRFVAAAAKARDPLFSSLASLIRSSSSNETSSSTGASFSARPYSREDTARYFLPAARRQITGSGARNPERW